jgi:hypothetical protein
MQIKETASVLKMTEESLLEEMKRYYNGFCFDGETFVYAPHSIVNFFKLQKFDNYWFNSGSSEQLVSFLQKKFLTAEHFFNYQIPLDRIASPNLIRFHDPAAYLFQLGYLSRKSDLSSQELALGYPNVEVKDSMTRRLFESYYQSPDVAYAACSRMQNAVLNQDPTALIAEINLPMTIIPYDDYLNASYHESFYRAFMLSLFHSAGLNPIAEAHKMLGRPDIIINYKNITWTI